MGFGGLTGFGGGIASRLFGGRSAKAEGGTTFDDGGYTFHVFTSTGTLEVYEDISVQFLIVGGGGSTYPNGATAPSYTGGSGGGGIVYNDNPQPLTAGSFPVVVGERMGNASDPVAPEPETPVSGTHGNPSSFNGYTAGAGGHAGGFDKHGQNGGPGTSLDGRPGQGGGGGGGMAPPGNQRSGGSGYNPGGPSNVRSGYTIASGGGGAFGGTGGTGTPTAGGAAADGVAIPWVPASYGTPGPTPGRWFGGGGAGSWYPVTSFPQPRAGGAGGGADSDAGPWPNPATNSVNNTGGGGAGNKSGASGIVIVRYSI